MLNMVCKSVSAEEQGFSCYSEAFENFALLKKNRKFGHEHDVKPQMYSKFFITVLSCTMTRHIVRNGKISF